MLATPLVEGVAFQELAPWNAVDCAMRLILFMIESPGAVGRNSSAQAASVGDCERGLQLGSPRADLAETTLGGAVMLLARRVLDGLLDAGLLLAQVSDAISGRLSAPLLIFRPC